METFLIPIQFNIKNSEHVYLLQQVLIFVLRDELSGEITIDPAEIAGRIYGESTKEAVAYFQSKYGIVQTPEVSEDTVNKLNQLAQKRYRLFGFITDKSSMPVGDIKLDVQYVFLGGANGTESIVMGRGISLSDGSYRVYLDFSESETEYLLDNNGMLKNKLCVNVKFSKEEGQIDEELYTSEKLFINDKESIQNFSNEKFIYVGDSLYVSLEKILALNGLSVSNLAGKTPKELQEIASTTDIDVEILMRMILAEYLQDPDLHFPIETSIVYGYFIQNFPSNLPRILFDEKLEGDAWEYYKSDLQKSVLAGIELLSKEDHISILSEAVKLRYITRLEEDEIIALAVEIVAGKYKHLETLPILEGDTSLAEISNAIKDIIVDDPAIWIDPSGFTENLIPAPKKREKSKKTIPNFLFERDAEETGGDGCYVSKPDENTIVFFGEITYTTQTDPDYRINAFPPFGHYVGVQIRIPENVDPYHFHIQFFDPMTCTEAVTFYYNDLGAKEIINGYIHIYIQLSRLFPYNPSGNVPDTNYDILIQWGTFSENFTIQTHSLFLKPYEYNSPTGMLIDRDFLHTGGEACTFQFMSPDDNFFYGMTEYSQTLHSYKHPSGYYAGVAILVSDRNILDGYVWHIRENGQGRDIHPEMLTTEEKSGGFVHIYFNLESPEYGHLHDVII
jgi:hypothetical protein